MVLGSLDGSQTDSGRLKQRSLKVSRDDRAIRDRIFWFRRRYIRNMGAWEGIPIDRMEPAQKQAFELDSLIPVLPFRELMGVC